MYTMEDVNSMCRRVDAEFKVVESAEDRGHVLYHMVCCLYRPGAMAEHHSSITRDGRGGYLYSEPHLIDDKRPSVPMLVDLLFMLFQYVVEFNAKKRMIRFKDPSRYRSIAVLHYDRRMRVDCVDHFQTARTTTQYVVTYTHDSAAVAAQLRRDTDFLV